MKKIHMEKGITLVTLVVTIIVILILSGVAISTVAGPNGLIEQMDKEKQNIIYKEESAQNKINQLSDELAK